MVGKYYIAPTSTSPHTVPGPTQGQPNNRALLYLKVQGRTSDRDQVRDPDLTQDRDWDLMGPGQDQGPAPGPGQWPMGLRAVSVFEEFGALSAY